MASGGRHAIDRGKRGEREVCALVEDLLGYKCRRSQAGHPEDLGDVFGLPGTTLQVADWAEPIRAVRAKPIEAEAQRIANGHEWVATWIRLRGGDWRVVLTPRQWAHYWREAT